jgi:Uma2 family endonuclease
MVTPTTTPGLLPLESGDRLTREEFHRRYEAMPEGTRAELIEGIVFVASPVRREHGAHHANIVGWLSVYASMHPELDLQVETTVFLGDEENEIQPDALLRRREGGTSVLRPDGYIQGPPEFVAEIAASSASYDLHDKFRVYERTGVAEYLVWQVYERQVRWFRLADGTYQEMKPNEGALLESVEFPGLRLHSAKLLEGDMAAVFEALH